VHIIKSYWAVIFGLTTIARRIARWSIAARSDGRPDLGEVMHETW
jgi:hypothetical protein